MKRAIASWVYKVILLSLLSLWFAGKIKFTDLDLLNDGIDAVNDEISLVFDFSNAPSGTGISFGTSGGEDNFNNGLYTAIIDVSNIDPFSGVLSDEALAGLTRLNETQFVDGDDSGQYTIVQTATEGDFSSSSESKPTEIENNTAYEDGAIRLNLNLHSWIDDDSEPTQGIESFRSITLTPPLESGTLSMGNSAYSDNVTIDDVTGALTIIAENSVSIDTVLEDIIFTPKTDFSGAVELTVTGTIGDTTFLDDTDDGAFITSPSNTTEDSSYTAIVAFNVAPVVDDVSVTADNMKGSEDEGIRLNNLTFTLGDVDGSEEFVSFKITNVPEDFQIKSLSPKFAVKNSGDGEWSIQIRSDQGIEATLNDLVILPAEDFSGTVNLGYSAFVQEIATKIPRETSGTFEVTISPVGDDIDTRIDTLASGIEGGEVVIQVNASIIDNENSISIGSNHSENNPETVYIKVDNVPESVLVTLPEYSIDDYTAVAEVVDGIYTGSWIITTTLQSVTSISLELTDTDYNNDYWSTDNAEVTINVYANDNGSLGQVSSALVSLDITPINDTPTLTLPVGVVGDEDTAINITSVVIGDADQFDDSNPDVDGHQDGIYTVTLSNSDGALSISDEAKLAFPNISVTSIPGELTLSGTVVEINDLLSGNYPNGTIGAEGVIFTPNQDFNGDTSINVIVDDNGNNGSGDALHTYQDQFNVSITPMNDTPTLTLPTNVVVDEDTIVNITSLVVGDVDQLDGSFDLNGSYTFALTNADGVLSISSESQLAFPDVVVTPVSNGLKLSGSISDINDLLSGNYASATTVSEGIIFTPNNDFNGETSVTVSVDDNGNNGSGVAASKFVSQFNVTVNAVNDAPENTLFDSLIIEEGSITKLVGLSVDDVDYATRPITTQITVTLSSLYGELSAQIPSSLLNTRVNSTDPNNLVIQGPISEVNQLLSATEANEGIFYTVDSSNTETSDTFTMVTSDGGNYDSVGTTVLEDTDVTNITISPVVSGIPQLQIALQAQQIRTNVSSTLAGVGIPLIGLQANLLSASELDSQETVVIRISDLPESATVTGATLSEGGWNIDASNLDSAEIHGLEESTVLSITAIASEGNAPLVESAETMINIVVDGDSTIGNENGDESDPLLIVAANDNTTLIGTSGADVLIGGKGEDIFIGGEGADEFVWTEANLGTNTFSNLDTILDFSIEDNDKINLLDLLDTGETLESFLQEHVTASIVDHDTVGDGKDVNLEIQLEGSNSPQTILLEGLGTQLGDTSISDGTALIAAMLENNIFKESV